LKALCGGEPFPRDLLYELLKRKVSVWNMYGPTETTVWSTCCELTDANKTISVGRPIANTRTYILDPNLHPVPVGVSGELHIGGHGVTRGYLNRPDQTRENFIHDPFDEEHGARMYKTGDLARYLSDGTIEVLGRIDNQVKIRGFRIELGEIEFVLAQHPGIGEAAVAVREDIAGDKRLVAYLVPTLGAAPPAGELRRFLAEQLPDYMIPSAFVVQDSLPLTPSGKVNRRALPAPDNTRPELVESYTAPRTPLEHALADIWSSVLGLEKVGVNDNFFDLGGHSLLGISLFARIEKQFDKKLPLFTLFQAPTISGLATVLDQNMVPYQHLSFISLGNEKSSKLPVYVMHSIGGELFGSHDLTSRLGVDRPVYGFKSLLKSGEIPIWSSLEEMANDYVQEMLQFQPSGPRCLLGYSFGGMVAYEIARNLLTNGHDVSFLGLVDTGPGLTFASPIQKLKAFQYWMGNFPLWVADIVKFDKKSLRRWIKLKAKFVNNRLHNIYKQGKYLRKLEDIYYYEQLPEEYEKIMQKNLRLLQNYTPKPYPGHITLFRAMVSPISIIPEPDLGWSRLAAAGVEVITIQGTNHGNILNKPYVSLVAEEMAAALGQIDNDR
jgi:thioesterase domain-containing protein/acyl carrier protein